MIRPQNYEGIIFKKKKLTSDVTHLEVKITSQDEKPEFNPGQFANLIFTINEKTYKRPYSIASSPKEENISFCIKKVPGGTVSTKINDELKEGDKVRLLMPLGKLRLPEELKTKENDFNIIFITVGTGIAPFRSMIRTIYEKTLIGTGEDKEVKTTLLFGTRYEEGILYYDEFSKLAEKNKNFKYLITLSREDNNHFLKGHVQEHLNKIEINEKTRAYICGLSIMVKEVKELLIEKGIKKENIQEEHYG